MDDPSIVQNEYQGGSMPVKGFQEDIGEFTKAIQEFMNGVKIIVGNKDMWLFVGAFFVNFVGPQQLTVEQSEKIAKLKTILEKEGELTFLEAGTMSGIIASLLSPAIEEVLKKQAPGILNIIGILTRLGGVI